MPRIEVTTVIGAPPAAVWDRLADIADHVTWMLDAAAIRFTGDRREGVGTTFECDTRVGPLRTRDRMEVVEWRPGAAMGVRHTGIVTGTGRFTLDAVSGGRTRLTWVEDLAFPPYLGGSPATRLAAPVLRRVWAGNLRRFAARVEPRVEGQATTRQPP
jgi:carbon monoxide dehydrogenase subunit G